MAHVLQTKVYSQMSAGTWKRVIIQKGTLVLELLLATGEALAGPSADSRAAHI